MGKKKLAKELFPLVYGWDLSKKERKEQWHDFKDNMEKLFDQYQDMKKAARKAKKEQWNTFFSQVMEMEQTVADSIPEDAPTPPGMPAPKEFIEKVKEYQETANEHAVEQADNMFDLMVERQKKAKEAVTYAVQNVEDKIDEYQADDEEEKEAEPVKPAAKRGPKPAAKAKTKA